jgi:uncharacterized protein YjbI with pentapeptide repeats/uncharacterized membrane protein
MKVQATKELVVKLSILLNAGLLFLLVFDKPLQVPLLLQVAGRVHPLVLHFPIVLIMMAVFSQWTSQGMKFTLIPATHLRNFILFTALASAISAVSGFLLAQEEGYSPGALNAHKWLGSAVSFAVLIWYFSYNYLITKKLTSWLSGLIVIVLLTAAGHQGAIITHGKDFLTAPLSRGNSLSKSITGDENLYSDIIFPILENKCLGCHNNTTAKGRLNMENRAQLLAGGKSGNPFDLQDNEQSLFVHRLLLPHEDKKHMPPAGKKQLSAEERAALVHWANAEPSFELRLKDLPDGDSLSISVAHLMKSTESQKPTGLKAVKPKTVEEMNSDYISVQPLYKNSAELAVSFLSAANFSSADLSKLDKIKNNITELNLQRMQLSTEDMNTIARFKNLHKLNLSFTSIQGSSLSGLNSMARLRHLALSGNRISFDDLSALSGLSALETIYLWETDISEEEMKSLVQLFPMALIETGYRHETASDQEGPDPDNK